VFFVDTHCHLNLPHFQANLQQVVDRAQQSGVNKIVVPGIDLETSRIALTLATRFEGVFAAIGVHPSETERFEKDQFARFEEMVSEPKVVAIGEIGLDFFHHPDKRTEQIELLEMMLQLATQNKKPVILHSRNALDALFPIIENWSTEQQPSSQHFHGVFHSFEGSKDQVVRVQSLSMAIGVGGPITYKNALEKQQMLKEMELNNLVLETDSPYLSPHPYRGQPNEPARISLIAQKVAELRQISVEETAIITTRNANNLFEWE
jgi:TatD DNase family protein